MISTDAAANLGDVVLADNVEPNEGKFTVAITKPAGFGALNVSSIVLNSSDVNWTGHSTLTSAGSLTLILGNVTGDIVAIERSGGGKAEGTTLIFGNVEGTLTIPEVTGLLQIDGHLSIGHVETINSGAVLQIGNLSSSTLNVTGALAGLLRFIGPAVHSIINIADFEGSGMLEMIGSPTYPEINLYNGVDSTDARVQINYHGGFIYMHDKDMLGVMNFPVFKEGAGVFDGGVLKGSVRCGLLATPGLNENRGTIEFASVAAGGEIIADVQTPFEGNIHIMGGMSGLIRVENDLTEFSPNARGEILIDGDSKGRVECNGDVTDSAEITIGGMLAGTGQINVEGVCDGDIWVGEKTTSNTEILCQSGLGRLGSIIINASAGKFNADGSIYIGTSIFTPITGDYDGCILIRHEAGTGLGGDLNGLILIALCDDETSSDPEFDHNVCADGDVNGSITVINSTCANQPGYACQGECP
ncbi:MAG: hypothetical protein O7D91_06065 [Planctomycetota bacterium]|nr:hypothetical protein [Planctomycetota bacterium]